jgi:hypothetical protein
MFRHFVDDMVFCWSAVHLQAFYLSSPHNLAFQRFAKRVNTKEEKERRRGIRTFCSNHQSNPKRLMTAKKGKTGRGHE